jgi:hypothetical protein
VHAARHASIIVQLAGSLRTALHQSASNEDALTRNAAKAKQAESRADEIVKETRLTVCRIPGTEVFRRILEVADDAVDDLEDSAFLAGLLSCQRRPPFDLPAPLLGLADLPVDGAHAFQRAHRRGAICSPRWRAREDATVSRSCRSRINHRAPDR